MVFTKTLNFNYENLGKEGYLVFTFDDPKLTAHKLYKDCFPVVWRVARLQAGGLHRFSETYEQQFLFTTSQLQQGIVTTGAAITRIDFKESTDLTGNTETGYNWSPPEKIVASEDIFEAHNLTDKVQGISVAIDKSSPPVIPEPLLYFGDVDPQAILRVGFQGRLRIYSVTDIQKGTVINAEISSPVLWDHYIGEKDLEEEWDITFNESIDNFEIKKSG